MEKRTLNESLEWQASRGASLSELKTKIDRRRRLLADEEREAAWLYAWALSEREERRGLASARQEGP